MQTQCASQTERWSLAHITALFELPLPELMYQAQTVHREHWDPTEIQLSTLLSIKTGGCVEDCGYCSQSLHHNSGLKREPLMEVAAVVEAAKKAQANGATRFCMGAAWRNPQGRAFERVLEMIKAVKGLGMETCVTLGMLTPEQIKQLEAVDLDFYNHNLDTSPEYYEKVTQTRTYADRIDTLESLNASKINVCCGGILSMGETRADRISMLHQISNLSEYPRSVPLNILSPIEGTPLGDSDMIDPLEFVRAVAVTRILMPKAYVRFAAGRHRVSSEVQFLCFLAGANSIFSGGFLLTTPTEELEQDVALLKRTGMKAMAL